MAAKMKEQTEAHKETRGFFRRPVALAVAVVALVAVLYFAGVPQNPPGFFVDESSIAYNAYKLSRDGADEHGEHWPLYFRAFGEYKSPVYIYLLAGLYRVTGPSIAVARALSATAGLLAALALGLLAALITRRRTDGLACGAFLCLTAALTPWLFEISRLVFEVALIPLLVSLFLLLLYDARGREDWRWPRAAALALVLALVTYTYSAGRLLAPLYALGLLLFVTRTRWRGVLRVWAAYAVALVPLFLFSEHHPGALGARFADVTFIKPTETPTQIALGFIVNFFGNFNPSNWLWNGDPEPRHHVPFLGSMLVATFILGLVGLCVVLLRYGREAWWRFIIYGLAASVVPSSLTLDRFHTLRLAAVPVFFLVLVAPGLEWLSQAGRGARARRAALVALLLLTVLQGAAFRWRFHGEAPRRWHNFDTFYPEVFAAALQRPERPIYIRDAHAAPGYMHAYWYATLRGMDISQFVRLSKDEQAPAGALVISTELPCTDCEIILHRGPFRAYVQR